MRIGVLAIQGDYAKHQQMLHAMGMECTLVRTEAELYGCDGLIIPGGESTTLTTVMQKHGLWQPLEAFGRNPHLRGESAAVLVENRRVLGENRPVTQRDVVCRVGRLCGQCHTPDPGYGKSLGAGSEVSNQVRTEASQSA